MTLHYILVLILGSIIGSFLNVCIYRMPRSLSVAGPFSMCPLCKARISFYDNIPILSFLLLRGRCRKCRVRISPRYPVVEALNAAIYAAAVWRYGLGWHTPALFVFCSAMIVIAFIDIDFQIIPNTITLPGIPIGLMAGSFIFPDPFSRAAVLGFKAALTGVLSGGGLFLLIVFLSLLILRKEGMGMGDVKMMAMVGAFMGWKSVLLTTFAGSLIGSLLGIFLMLFRGKGRGTKIPFGPFLAAGAIITLFFGQEILAIYLYG